MQIKYSQIFIGLLILGFFTTCSLIIYSHMTPEKVIEEDKIKSEFVKFLRLTDACLTTDASYTRNPSITDLATPFQDFPASIDHFPTGSVIAPPDLLWKWETEIGIGGKSK